MSVVYSFFTVLTFYFSVAVMCCNFSFSIFPSSNLTFTWTFSQPTLFPVQKVKTIIFFGEFLPVGPAGVVAGNTINMMIQPSIYPIRSVSLLLTASPGYILSRTTLTWDSANGNIDTFTITAPGNAILGTNCTVCLVPDGTDKAFYVQPPCFGVVVITPSPVILVTTPQRWVSAASTTTLSFKLGGVPYKSFIPLLPPLRSPPP